MIDLQFQPILDDVEFPVCDHPAMSIYIGGLETVKHSAANSSMTAVPGIGAVGQQVLSL
jgi:hypothetical protein